MMKEEMEEIIKIVIRQAKTRLYLWFIMFVLSMMNTIVFAYITIFLVKTAVGNLFGAIMSAGWLFIAVWCLIKFILAVDDYRTEIEKWRDENEKVYC